MRSRPVTAGVQLTELGLGGAALGNLYRAVSDDDALAAVEAAWDAGVRYFDTAPHYGLGLSERRLGRALASYPRDDYVLSTKVGRLLVDDPSGAGRRDDEGFDVPATTRRVWDFSRDGVLRSIEASLERLGLDRVDVVFLHDPDDHWQGAVSQAYPALAELRAQGVVRAIGAGMNQSAMLTRFVRETDLDLVMLAGRYTLIDQGADADLLPAALEHDVAVVAAGVFNSGLLARQRPRDGAHYDYEEASHALVDRARKIAEVCAAHGTTLPAAALQFTLAHPAVTSVVVGARDGAQMRGNLAALDDAVPASLWSQLHAEGLLPEDAAVGVAIAGDRVDAP